MKAPEDADAGRAFGMTFDGRPVEALPGRTIAAALWAAGVTSWRTTRDGGRPRGVFCGIGVCFDCLVTVNGRPNQRACLVPARPGDVVRTQEGTGHAD
ncbi:(2Fe-2S)-binding protein [Streptomyces pseudogriseolus]|uniref:(2Fe-2S)-binding protein n=1 Tax=Streptomyces pseudogriseolus TaxID=36817 RepID=UPI003FA1C6E6